jgi:hypothetical protein
MRLAHSIQFTLLTNIFIDFLSWLLFEFWALREHYSFSGSKLLNAQINA